MRIRVVYRPGAAASAQRSLTPPRPITGRDAAPLGYVTDKDETVVMTGDADLDIVRRQLVRARGEVARIQAENREIVGKVKQIHAFLEQKFGKIDGEAFRNNLDPDSLPGAEGRKFRELLAELEGIGGTDDEMFRTTRFAGRHMGKML